MNIIKVATVLLLIVTIEVNGSVQNTKKYLHLLYVISTCKMASVILLLQSVYVCPNLILLLWRLVFKHTATDHSHMYVVLKGHRGFESRSNLFLPQRCPVDYLIQPAWFIFQLILIGPQSDMKRGCTMNVLRTYSSKDHPACHTISDTVHLFTLNAMFLHHCTDTII